MRRKLNGASLCLIAVVVALACAMHAADKAHAQKDAPKADEATKQEQDKLRGAWVVTQGVVHGGGTDNPNSLRSMVYIVNDRDFGDRLVIHLAEGGVGDKVRHYPNEFKLDVSKKPKTIDLSFGQTYPGIYELDGDTLKICAGLKNRPTEFKYKEGETSIWLHLHRQK